MNLMTHQIAFTLTEVGAVCALIVSFGTAITMLLKLKDKASEPNKRQDERLSKLEAALEEHRIWLGSDKKRIESLEQSLSMIMKCQFFLLSHAINGNDVDKLKDIQGEMHSFLSTRGIIQ